MRMSILLVGLVVVMAAATALSKPAAQKSGRGVLSGLEIGQEVGIKDLGASFELEASTRKVSTSYKVAEIGDDYIVLANKPKLLELRIPVSSIKMITYLKR